MVVWVYDCHAKVGHVRALEELYVKLVCNLWCVFLQA